MSLQVRTEALRQAAESIEADNSSIRGALADMRDAMRELDASWDGTASESARRYIELIDRTYFDRRDSEIRSLASFVGSGAAEAYRKVEDDLVRSISDAFK